MATILYVRSDIESRIFNGPPPDDTHITREAILYKMNTVRAALFQKMYGNLAALDILPDWLTRLDCQSASVPETDCCGTPAYFALDLPSPVMSLPDDQGIVSVEMCGNPPVAFTHGTPGSFVLTRNMRFGKPSRKNPYFYRVGERLYLMAGERLLDRCDFTIFAALDSPIDVGCGLTIEAATNFPMPNHLLEPLCQAVAGSFLSEMQVPQDTANDGKEKGVNKVV